MSGIVIMIIFKVFIKHKILSVDTILSVHTCMHAHIHARTHACAHMHAHTHTHTHIHTQAPEADGHMRVTLYLKTKLLLRCFQHVAHLSVHLLLSVYIIMWKVHTGC